MEQVMRPGLKLVNLNSHEGFDYNLLYHYIEDGYRYILYYSMDHFALLVPCMDEPETDENSYALPITDEQVLAMAENDEFRFMYCAELRSRTNIF